MAFIGLNQFNHNQQIDEYEYDDFDDFYDDNLNSYNSNNHHEVDDSEGKQQQKMCNFIEHTNFY